MNTSVTLLVVWMAMVRETMWIDTTEYGEEMQKTVVSERDTTNVEMRWRGIYGKNSDS